MATASTTIATPIMTSNTAPSGIVNASSFTSGLEPWRAFDGLTTTAWATASAALTGWLSYDFQRSVSIRNYAISGSGTANETPKNWTFEGSNDGNTWVILDTQTNITFAVGERKVFNTTNLNWYRIYRLNVSLNGGSTTRLALRLLEMYENIFLNKTLILNNGQYKKYVASAWQNVSTTPTEADYLNGNSLSEFLAIPESAWQQLVGAVELCFYTDDTAKTEAQFSIETNPFTLADEWANQTTISLIEYTDNPTQTESATTIETDPFAFYDEMGNSFDVLYYTDDAAKTSAILDITANYNPIDELVNPSLLLWTDAIQPLTKTVNKTALPLPQTVKQSIDTFIDGDLVNFNLSVMENGDFAAVKTLLSGDSGLTWKTFKKGTWTTVDINNQGDFIKKGMSAAEVNALTESTLALLGNKNKIRFAYCLKKRYVTDNASVQSLNASDRTFYPTPAVSNITINYDEIDKRFYALLFMDELNQVYSTSVGEILQYLDIGSLIAGQTSEEFKVLLNNGYNYAVNNIRLTAWNDLSGVSIEISKSNAPFIPASELTFNATLSEGQSIEFYVRVSTERTAQATGIFSITAKADPIRP
jgi:hypothetical protein